MPFQPNEYSGRKFIADTATFDMGLRRHMISVYNYMMLGLVLSGAVAWYVGHSFTILQAIYGSSLGFIVMLLPLAFVLVLSFGINKLSVGAAQLTFFAYSAVMGVSLATIFLRYTGHSVAELFFISATMFAATSLYGYTTKKNLSGMGSFLMMGLFGIIIAGLVNFFLHSNLLGFAMSIVCVIVFTGFTAYDTQKIRDNYNEAYGVQSNAKLAIMGALNLYLDFINLFLAMLRLFGRRN